MFTKESLDFKVTQTLNKLVSDYISVNTTLEPFYEYLPNKEGYSKLLDTTSLFSDVNRILLTDVLSEQAGLVNNTSQQSIANIRLLSDTRTFTITTGHQLCLFTGPLYFIHKIASVISICNWLKKEFPHFNFVPVYWLASEDHDAEEVNHVNVFGKKISWNTTQSGAVGRFRTNNIGEAINELTKVLGETDHSKELSDLFKRSYLEHKNLALATRYLVNALFGKHGIVILDGDHSKLKRSFIDLLEKDIFENIPFSKVSGSIEKLKSLGYHSQVNPREINCFYIENGLRERIEHEEGIYKVLNTSLSFSKAELTDKLHNSPENFSPNVVTRPLFQQHLLPNIAYVGGPGELSYWLEYKDMFKAMNVQFPILHPRKFILILEKNIQQKLIKLNLNTHDVFTKEDELIARFIESKGDTIDLTNEKKILEAFFGSLLEKSNAVDKSLEATVKGEAQKALNGISNIESKLNKALKQRSENEINQIKNIRSKLFPGGVPQERVDNISVFYAKWGQDIVEYIIENCHAEELSYMVIKDN